MYRQLQLINARPTPFEKYTAAELWTDEYTSAQMLAYHLDGAVDISSRRTEFIDRSAGWIVSHFGLGDGKAVVDFGCGPGLYTSRLAAAGTSVTGVDFSARSLQYAREQAKQKNLTIDYVQANYLEFETDRLFDLITMIMCDFCALSPGQRHTLLRKFFALLRPGGAVLLDVYSLRAFADREEVITYEPGLLGGFWSPKPYFGFLNTFKYEKEKVILDKYTIIEEARTREIYNWLQYFDRDTLAKTFEDHGFRIEAFFGDVAGAPFDESAAEFAIVATRPL